MAHELRPRLGEPYLPVDEVVRRVTSAFESVDLDADAADRSLRASIEYV